MPPKQSRSPKIKSEESSPDTPFVAPVAPMLLPQNPPPDSTSTKVPNLAPDATLQASQTMASSPDIARYASNVQSHAPHPAPYAPYPAPYAHCAAASINAPGSMALFNNSSIIPLNEQLQMTLAKLNLAYVPRTRLHAPYIEPLRTTDPSELTMPNAPTSGTIPATAGASASNVRVPVRKMSSPLLAPRPRNPALVRAMIKEWLVRLQQEAPLNPLDPNSNTPPQSNAPQRFNAPPPSAPIGPSFQIPPIEPGDSELGFDSDTLASRLTSKWNTTIALRIMRLTTLVESNDGELMEACRAMTSPTFQNHEEYDLDDIMNLEELGKLVDEFYDEEKESEGKGKESAAEEEGKEEEETVELQSPKRKPRKSDP